MDIEGVAMDREVMRLRDMLTPKFSEMVYNGFWFSPEMDFLMAAINKSQEVIDGVVYLSLYKGNVSVLGRESPSSLYDKDLSSMDIEGGFNQQDSLGFINLLSFLEKTFSIRIEMSEITMDKFSTIDRIAEVVDEKLKAAGTGA